MGTKRRHRLVALGLAGCVTLAACGTGSDPFLAADDSDLFADVPADEPPAVSDAELATAVDGVNALGLDLLRTVGADGGNLLVGPWSITEGLALPYAGARGDTAAQMADVLHLDLPDDQQHGALARLREEVLSRARDELEISAASRAYGQEGMSFTEEYLARLRRSYATPLSTVDFADVEAARAEINGWVADETRDRIPELFPAGTIDSDTRLALVSATYLRASWYFPFNAELTEDEPFHLADGSVASVPTMHFNEYLPSGSGPDWQVVQLPYTGDELSMLVIVPRDLDAWLPGLDLAELAAVRSSITDGGIHLGLPRFELSSHTSLVGPLEDLGLTAPFGGSADFSGITGARGLYIDAIEHETYVRVDEEGTEAAAATGSAMQASHGPTVTVDRPFVFLVQDDATGAVLFAGIVRDPRS